MKRAISIMLGLATVLSLLMASMSCGSPGGGPSVQTDKPDYQPEEIVAITGAGFSPGPVDLKVTRPDGEIDEIPDVSADSSGSFAATYQLDGITGMYVVDATDSAGQTAQITFTDGSLTVGSQVGTLTYGTPGSVSYTVTVDGSGNADVDLSISALPAGASEVFSPNPIDGDPGSWTKTSTLTITTTSGTPAGTHPFTVSGTSGAGSGSGTLTIGGSCTNYWHDLDGDGHGAGSSECLTSPPGYQYATNGDDCDDGDPNVWSSCGSCVDNDGDDYYAGCDDYDTIDGPDCDDGDPNVWSSCGSCVDNDGDDWYVGCDAYDTIDGPDCDDSDPNVWSSCGSCVDNDGDGYYVGCDDYDTIDGPDCDDSDPNNWISCSTCVDDDGDGYYTGCDAYDTINGPDIDDGDPGVPGGGAQSVVVPPPRTWYALRTSSTEGGQVTKPRWGIEPYLGYYRYAYYEGEVVTLEATPDAGYHFVNWTGDVETIDDVNAASTTVVMNGFYEITANFEAT